jgi:hypothetical protein
MNNKLDSKKYLNQYAALEEAAKTEIIQLLSNNPAGRYIYFDCDIDEEDDAYSNSVFPIMDGNEQVLHICGVGLNDDKHIVIITDDDEENWFEPDEWTHAYLEMYKFVVDNLDHAKQSIVTDAGTQKSDEKEFSDEEFLGIIADQYKTSGLSKDELIKAGEKGLAFAREIYAKEQGLSFHDTAEWHVRQAIQKAIAEKKGWR